MNVIGFLPGSEIDFEHARPLRLVRAGASLAPARPSPRRRPVLPPGRADATPMDPTRRAMLGLPLDQPSAPLTTNKGSASSKLVFLAFVFGAVMLAGAFVAFEGSAPALQWAPYPIAAAQDLTRIELRGEDTFATSGEAGETLPSQGIPPTLADYVDVVGPSIDSAQAPAGKISARVLPQAPVDIAQTPIGPASPPSPDPEAFPAASPPPGATQVTISSPPAVELVPAPIGEQPVDSSPKAASVAAGSGQASSDQSPSRPMLASSNGVAPAPAAAIPVHHAAPRKTGIAARAALGARRPTVRRYAARLAPALVEQPSNPLARAFGDLIRSLAAAAGAGQHGHDSIAATSSGRAVQLGAPEPENEARADAARLNLRYGHALHRAAIGVRKAEIDGATIYRLRAFGLSADAAEALCARVKGDDGDCVIGKFRS